MLMWIERWFRLGEEIDMSVDTATPEVTVEEEYFERPADTLGNTRRFARLAHGPQTDKLGRPYVGHLDAVAHNVYMLVGMDMDLIKAALLHDTLEDTAVTQAMLEEAGFSPRTIHAVLVVTKMKGEANWSYTTRVIKGGTGPMIVKLADLYHNASPKRLAGLKPLDRDRLEEKYHSAIFRIEHALVKEGVLIERDKTMTLEKAYDAVKPYTAKVTSGSNWEWKKRHPQSIAVGDRIRFKADPTAEFEVMKKRVKSNGQYAFEVTVDGEPLGMEINLDFNHDAYETKWRAVSVTNPPAHPIWKKRLGMPQDWEYGDPIPDTLEGEKA